MKTKQKISFDDFMSIESKLDIRIGQVAYAERIPKKDKLLKLTVIFGSEEEDEKTVVTNLGEFYEPDYFLAQRFPFIVNLEPAKLGGIVSEAMIMVSSLEMEDRKLIEPLSDNYRIGSKLL